MNLFMILLIVSSSIQIGVTMRSTAATGDVLPRLFCDLGIIGCAAYYFLLGRLV